MSIRPWFLQVTFLTCTLASIPARGEVERTDAGVHPIVWSDDFLRSGGAEFLDAQQQDDYCLYGTAPRPEYTAVDPLLSGGYNSTSITIGNGIMGVNHDEFRNPPPIPPYQICFAELGWHNLVGPCIGGSLANEHDYPFTDDDVCVYSAALFSSFHLKAVGFDDGPWGPDFRSGYAGVDDDGDGTTDWNLHGQPEFTAWGGNNQEFGSGSTFNNTNTPPGQIEVTGIWDINAGTGGCVNDFPDIEEYDIRATQGGFYPGTDSNGLDDDLDGTVDNEPIWRATVRRKCDGTFLALDNGVDDDADGATDEGDEINMFFPSGVIMALDAGLSIEFTEIPPGIEIPCCGGGNGEWDIDIWPAQFVEGFTVGAETVSTINEFYGRNLKFNSGNPGFMSPHGPDGKAGIAGVDDDGNGVTDEFPTVGRPGTDDDGDGQTDEFDEVVLDELGERNFGDDADDTIGRTSQTVGLNSEPSVGTAVGVVIDPGSGGGGLFSIGEFVAFQGGGLADADEIGPGFYQPDVNYGFVLCVSGTCYGAQLWVGNDVGNPVETLGPVVNTDHDGPDANIVAAGAIQGGSGVLHLMERNALAPNEAFDDKFWAIEGTTDKPTVTVLQDRDRDGDVDGVDFSVFASCFNKAGNPPRTAGCTVADAEAMDSDNDGDVDGVDFSVFASCFNKAGNLPRAAGCYVEVSNITTCVP